MNKMCLLSLKTNLSWQGKFVFLVVGHASGKFLLQRWHYCRQKCVSDLPAPSQWVLKLGILNWLWKRNLNNYLDTEKPLLENIGKWLFLPSPLFLSLFVQANAEMEITPLLLTKALLPQLWHFSAHSNLTWACRIFSSTFVQKGLVRKCGPCLPLCSLSSTPSLRSHPVSGVSFELAESKLVFTCLSCSFSVFLIYLLTVHFNFFFCLIFLLPLLHVTGGKKKNEWRAPSRRSVIIPVSSGTEFCSLFQEKRICGLKSFSLEVHHYVFVRRAILKADWAM